MEMLGLCYIFLTVFNVLVVKSEYNCPDVENQEDVTFYFNSVCYHYVENVEEQVVYSSADENCRSRNGRLVTIKDNVTQVELVSKLQFLSDSHTVLLGLKKYGNEWKWPTGETLSYVNWDSSSVCNGTCDCVKMRVDSLGKWQKFACETSDWYTVYLCEYGATSKAPGAVTSQLLLVILCSAWTCIEYLVRRSL